MWKYTATFSFFVLGIRDIFYVWKMTKTPLKNQQIYFYTFQNISTILVQLFLQTLGPGRHFLWRMDFSNVFVEFSTGFWTYPLLLFWLLCFFSFSPVWVCQWRHKAIANTSKYARWKNFSYNTFLVDVTLAIYKLSQKSRSNVNISASAVPKGFLARAKIPIISVVTPLREMFFSVAKFLAHTRNKLKQVKTFVQCSLREKLPWNANVVGMSHEHWPHANFTRFQKNNLGYFWPRLPTVKVFVF